ncbi:MULTISPECIES: hypothetical protein [Acinetobacter]|nr:MULTISPECIES: hypothetical protein [Acinetobacter]ENU83020.1 hypothetical protein F974_01852 [Acinetobacter sp. CIP 102159]ENV70715.1 hypothetical protein F947_00721 [Acinetobacter towneri DSM 14962 = CIP 107472]
MKNFIIAYVVVALLYWAKLIFVGGYYGSAAFLLGRAIMWPFIFLGWVFG